MVWNVTKDKITERMAIVDHHTWTPPMASPALAPDPNDRVGYSPEIWAGRLDVDDVIRPIYKEAGEALGREFPYPEEKIGWIDMPHTQLKLVLVMLCAVCTAPVYSQTVDHDSSEHESASAHESAHESHQNVVSFFAGVTHAGRRKNAAALGVGYEREPEIGHAKLHP